MASDPAGTDWSDREIDLIVADYFSMLRMELADVPYVKAQRNAALQALIRRSRGSIEFKHQNISAVLVKLGMPWIPGYKPLPNFQHALIAGVERQLDAQPDLFNVAPPADVAMREEPSIVFEPPPPRSEPIEVPDPLRRLVRKFDPAARDDRNRALGRLGEQRVLAQEISRLRDVGRVDLSRKVRWVSDIDGDGAGFDILSFDVSGRERLLEVKTTGGGPETPFFLSENERALSDERPAEFRLVRLYDFHSRAPRAFELLPPLTESVLLRPANYRASFE